MFSFSFPFTRKEQMMNVLKTVSAAALVATLGTAAQPEVVYSDDFAGDVADTLIGTAEDTNGTELWQGNTFFRADGSIDSPGTGNARGPALLAFMPVAGKNYTAEGEMTIGTGNVMTFGFSQAIDNIRFHNQAGLSGWAFMFASDLGQSAHEGPYNQGVNVTDGDNEVLANSVKLTIVLDTTGSEWAASYYVNDLVFTEDMVLNGLADGSAGSINYVGFAAGNSFGDLDSLQSFTLTEEIPEPGSLALLGLGGTLMMARRRRSNWSAMAHTPSASGVFRPIWPRRNRSSPGSRRIPPTRWSARTTRRCTSCTRSCPPSASHSAIRPTPRTSG